ncbi:MAG: hypothetical protein KJ066_19600 [Acidobacteria bacterium]|nr:hypothetical protein [Acidobacteriota bacterium]
MRRRVLCLFLLLAIAGPVAAQETPIPPPTGPVVFCGEQIAPTADTYALMFDGGAPEALTMDAAVEPACPVGTTHSFRVPAARFTVGQHTLAVRATNAYGTTDGPIYTVTVGIAPGPFSITAVIPPGA